MILQYQQKLNIQLIFQDQIEDFVQGFIIMGAIVFYLLMLQKYISSKQKILK